MPGRTGGRETYAMRVVQELLRSRPDIRFTAFVNRETAGSPWPGAVRAVVLPVRSENRLSWAFGEQTLLPVAARRAGIEVLHSMANTSPATGPFRRVVTVHDVLHRRFPELHSTAMRLGTDVIVGTGARRAHAVITGSQASADDLVEFERVPRERILVTPYGVEVPPGERRPDGSVLCVASDLPHKNLDALRAAWDGWEGAPPLVLAGVGTERVGGRGVVTHEELSELYARASCVVLPSLHEGFGLPVIEAMARGVPVACSDITVLREVAGGLAEFFEPRDPAAVRAAVRRCLTDPRDAAQLRAHAARFTWSETARGTAEAYERALA